MITDFAKWNLNLDEAEKIVSKLSNYTPKKRDIFKAFKLCKYDDLKVVMLGQD